MNLVQHHQPFQTFQSQQWIFQPPLVARILQIKVRSALGIRQRLRQRGLPALTRPEQCHHRTRRQSFANLPAKLSSLNIHDRILDADRPIFNKQNPQPSVAFGKIARRFFENHALAVFEVMGGRVDDDLACRILGWIRRNATTKFSLSECYNMLRHGDRVAVADDLLPALTILESRNFIRELPETEAPRRGRKPSPTYEVNPATHDAG